MPVKDWLLFLPFVGFGVIANLLIKTGLGRLHLDSILSSLLLTSPWIWGGAVCYGLGLLNYLYLLNRLPLNLVQPFSAIAFVGVILVSRFVLGEPISSMRWVGIGLVAAGIVVIGRSA